jgi:transcription antitermination protein NusB
MALQMLYQSDMGGATLPQVLRHFNPIDYLEAYREEGESESISPEQHEQMKEALEYARKLVEGTLANLEELDGLIREQAENWRLERMSAVDRNVLRLAVYELLHEPDVPKLVVIDEAIELAKRYGSEQSGRFVNGLLDGMLRSREFPGRLH